MAELLPEVFGEDADTLTRRLRLIEGVPALRARMFEAMGAGTHRILREIIGARTGRASDDPDVQAFCWAVLGVL